MATLVFLEKVANENSLQLNFLKSIVFSILDHKELEALVRIQQCDTEYFNDFL